MNEAEVDAAVTAMAGVAATAVEARAAYRRDRARIVADLLGGADPGPPVAFEPAEAERHLGRRAAVLLRFGGSAGAVVYIPRPMQGAELYGRLLSWLDARHPGLAPEAVPTVVCDGYGWARLAVRTLSATEQEARLFHRRQGARLALLHATNAATLDAETLLHPVIERKVLVGPDPAVAAHERSVLRTLVPELVPELAPDPADHLDDLLRGFAMAYDAICRDADSFCRELAAGADIVTRFVARPAYQYLAHLAYAGGAAGVEPSLGTDLETALEPDLEPAFDGADALLDAERRELAAGELPVFFTRPGSRAVWTSRDERLDDVAPACGLDSALAKVRAMGPRDRRRQEWMIEAALAATSATVQHWCLATGSAADAGAPDPQRALDQAEAVARELGALAYRDGRRVNWLGLEPLEDGRWTVLPSGLGLGHGYSGIALFLARLGALTGRSQYSELAAAAMTGAPALVAALAERPGHLAAIGGGFAGLDGVAYALGQLSMLLESSELRDAASVAAELAGRSDVLGQQVAPHAGLFDAGLFNDSWCSGVAGLAAAGVLDATDRMLWLARLASSPPLADLTVCHGEFGVLEALAVLADRGDEQARATLHRRAARLPDPVASGAAYSGTPGAVPTPGLLHGLAGVGYGLLRVAFPEQVPSVLTLESSR
jgi:lantibiotic modifying enzyme